MLVIHANNVSAGYDNGVLGAGFGGTADGNDVYLMLMGAPDEPDEQDIELGMDTHYIELNDQGRGGYGGLSHVELAGRTVTLTLTETGKNRLGLHTDTVQIRTQLDEAEWANLAHWLREMFEHDPAVSLTEA